MDKIRFQDIYEALLNAIESRSLLPGDALPSENELCAKFGVSRPTARKAIEKLELSNLIVRRPGVGSFVASPSEEENRKKSSSRFFAMDCILDHHSSSYYGPLIESAREKAAERNFRLCLIEHKELADIRPGDFHGVISAMTLPDEFDSMANLARSGMPVVLFNRFPPQPELSYFSVNCREVAFRLIDRLIRNGTIRIALLGAYRDTTPGFERAAGYREAFAANGLDVSPGLMLEICDFFSDNSLLSELLLREKPDVLFLTHGFLIDSMVMTVLKTGLRIPEDLSLICFDDLKRFTETSNLPISYIKMPLQQMGHLAVEYLDRRVQDPAITPPRRLLEASLVVKGCKYLL